MLLHRDSSPVRRDVGCAATENLKTKRRLDSTRSRAHGRLGSAVLVLRVGLASAAHAGKGGASHIMPRGAATLADLPPTSPGGFVKPMLIHYRGDASANIPTGAGIVTDLNASANTFVLGGGDTFDQTVLGGAHFSMGAFLPCTWLSISGDSQALGGIGIESSVNGFGDMTVVPVLLAWKSDDWQCDFLMPIHAPTGSHQTGCLGNTGLNYSITTRSLQTALLRTASSGSGAGRYPCDGIPAARGDRRRACAAAAGACRVGRPVLPDCGSRRMRSD